jgi:Mg-chelatase subunit ChlD
MAYTAQMTRANPTLVVFLLDQSGSMAAAASASPERNGR